MREPDPRGYEGLDTRIGRVRYLLDSWDSIFGPFVGSAMGGSGSGLPPMLSRMARHPSVQELDRCLSRLEREDVQTFRHVKAFRCGVEWRCVTRNVRVKRPRGKGYEVTERRVREPLVPAWVDRVRVADGERFLVSEFQGEVFVPDDLYKAWKSPALSSA